MNRDDDKFVFYRTRVDNRAASVTVNLSLGDRLHDDVLPVFNVLIVRMLTPNDQGLSSPDEFDMGVLFEDRFIAHTDRRHSEYVGKITTNGQWQYCFYCDEQFDWKALLLQVLQDDREYHCTMQRRLDPKHSTYFQSFYPSRPDERFQVLNFEVVQSLREQGVDLTIPHMVIHSLKISASSLNAAQQCLRESPEVGKFSIEASDGQIELISQMIVTLETINVHTLAVIACATRFKGEYLGCVVSHS